MLLQFLVKSFLLIHKNLSFDAVLSLCSGFEGHVDDLEYRLSSIFGNPPSLI